MTEKSLEIISLRDPAELGLDPDLLRVGDRITGVSGQLAEDQLDFFYLTAPEIMVEENEHSDGLLLTLERPDGATRQVRISMAVLHELDVTFAPMDFRRCRCKCKFCFVDQMPPGLRETLYYKDEDFRLSFLYGNYTTLIDITGLDIDRIIRQNLSPQYVSVHVIDKKVREWIFGRPEKNDISDTLLALAKAGISLHTQAVLCPGINDGPRLDETIERLEALHPKIESLAVVPVGLTSHRRGLADLRTYRPDEMESVISQVEAHQRKFLSGKRQDRFVYLSDEWYLGSGRLIPDYVSYGDFPQLDNGVGMTRAFIDEIADDLAELDLPRRLDGHRIVTGRLGEKIFRRYIFPLLEPRVETLPDMVVVNNQFFGQTVTCSGLLAAYDIAEAIKAAGTVRRTWLPPNVLNFDGYFLDGPSLEELEAQVSCRLELPSESLVQAWAGEDNPEDEHRV